ncbi:adenylyl-sulfate kinase [Phenylobacterium sp. LjRoot164]|uniref:adenylyl-sulfate kinase n=1 Tax=unclassified Phenylobacterium TaxID=2640670 RepID=UPI003ECDE07E
MEQRPRQGDVYWVTGLSGAGKSTLARFMASRLRAAGRSVVELDGDRIRPITSVRLGYGLADRRLMAMVYARLCREFSQQGHDVVCATVSMCRQARGWARAEIPGYREIYLGASPATIARRHPRGLVAAALAGRIGKVPGVDLPIEPPERPEVRVNDDGGRDPAAIAAEVMGQLWPGGAP